MKVVACRSRITVGQALAGMAAVFALLVFTPPCLAKDDDHRTLKLLLDKGIITQQEYDQAADEDQRTKAQEELQVKPAPATTKSG